MAAGAVVTPSMGGDSGASGGGDIFAGLGAELSGAYDSAVAGEGGGDSPDPGAAEPSAAEPPTPETVVADPVADNQTDPNAQAEPAVDPNTPFQLSPDGKFYQVPKAQLPQLQTAQKFHEAVSQYFSTPQEAQQAHAQAADLRIMANDFMSGTEQGLQQMLRHWAGFDHAANPAMQARYQQSFAKMASHMPEVLRQVNPQAHEALQNQFITASIDAAYQKAVQTGNPDDFKTAQERDYGFTGQYKTDISQITKPQPQQQNPGQSSAAEQRLQATFNRDLHNDFMRNTEQAKFGDFRTGIDKLLKPVEGRYSPETLAAVKDAIHKQAVDAIRTQRPEWWTEHEQEFRSLTNEYRTAWMRGDPNPSANIAPRIQAYKTSFMQQAQRVLPSIVQKHIGAATASAAARASNGQFAASQPQTRPQTPAAAPATNGRISKDQWNSEWAKEFANI